MDVDRRNWSVAIVKMAVETKECSEVLYPLVVYAVKLIRVVLK